MQFNHQKFSILVVVLFILFGTYLYDKSSFQTQSRAPASDSSKDMKGEANLPGKPAKTVAGIASGPNKANIKGRAPSSKEMTGAEWVSRPYPQNGQGLSRAEGMSSVQRYVRSVDEKAFSVSEIYFIGLRMSVDLTYAKEYLDEAALQEMSLELGSKGFIVDRSKVFSVYPDHRYFLDLARQKGTKADVAFFENEFKTSKRGHYAFFKPITEYYSCSTYGKGLLFSFYKTWATYREKFPRSPYSQMVKDRLTDVKQEIVENHCICGNEKSVKSELKFFTQSLPQSKITTAFSERLQKIKGHEDDQEEFRFNCKAPNSTGDDKTFALNE